MTIISKAAGTLGLISSLRDIHKNALIYSKRANAKTSANTYISNSLSNQRAYRLSTKDAERKNWLARKNLLMCPAETWSSFKGYLGGFFDGVVNYFPQLLLSGLAIGINNKYKVLGNLCATLLAIIEGVDFVNNTLSPGQKNDYLKIK